jgi:bacteriocin-like protein
MLDWEDTVDREPENNKTEDTANTTLSDKELNEVVGGVSSGKHIAKVMIDDLPPHLHHRRLRQVARDMN